MNSSEVQRIERPDTTLLLYSHDDSFTRHVVEIGNNQYQCRINEEPCFRRGTHDRMAKLHGFDLTTMERQWKN